jgi:CelD/BcsL family acetyltransferase involved in cellulose biosynthesis
MRTPDVLHYWFPTYNHAFSRYSPGLLLLSAIAKHADSRGYSRIDLGKGDDAYKSRVANSRTEVREGVAERHCGATTAISLARKFDQRVSTSRWMKPLALPGRIIRKYQRLTRHH